MATKKQQILNAKRRRTSPVAAPTAADQFSSIKDKFRRLAEIRAQLQAAKSLYQQHDALLAELIPLFITKTDTQFIVQREITLGNETHRLIPYFYNEKTGALIAKQWKSTAFETVGID